MLNKTTIDEDSIKRMHLDQFLHHVPAIIFGHLIAVSICVFLMIQRVDGIVLIAWLIAFGIIICCRAAMYIHQKKHPSNSDNWRQRVFWHIVASGALGVLGGGLAFILLGETDSSATLVILLILIGLSASAVAPTANLPSVFYAFALFAFAPALIKLMLLGGYENWLWVGLISGFLFFTKKFSNDVHEAATDAIRFRYNNMKIISNLKQEKLRAEKSQQNAEYSLKHAETTSRAKTQFLAAASHDLRQPLHALRLLSATLENTDLQDQQVPIVSNISASVKSLEELLNSLLDVSKLDAGTQTVTYQTLYLSDVFDNIQRNFQSLSESHGVKLIIEESGALIHTDAILLERLLSNLISNAIRYSPEGTVTVSSHSEDKHCVIQVRDNGVGISKEDQQRIFEEFVQLDNPERDRSKGIGLGLSIVKRTAELLNLPLDLSSVLGQGSMFKVTVPLGSVIPKPIDKMMHSAQDQHIAGMLALVVDDEITVRTAVEGLLDSWGCAVISASNGDEAEEIVRGMDALPDAIIADLRLGDHESGVDVIERVNNIFDDTCPAIIITGDIAPSRLQLLRDAPYPILHKPCDPQELKDFLSTAYQPSQ